MFYWSFKGTVSFPFNTTVKYIYWWLDQTRRVASTSTSTPSCSDSNNNNHSHSSIQLNSNSIHDKLYDTSSDLLPTRLQLREPDVEDEDEDIDALLEDLEDELDDDFLGGFRERRMEEMRAQWVWTFFSIPLFLP